MNKKTLILILLVVFLSGCIESRTGLPDGGNSGLLPDGSSAADVYSINTSTRENDAASGQTNDTEIQSENSSRDRVSGHASITSKETPLKNNQSELPIDRISLNLSNFYDKKWNSLYQEDELDCSRMSVYLWNYIRTNYHVQPKIVVSYQREHAWLALKVSDVGNSTSYMHWNIRGVEYYYLESTIPKIVADDNERFLINDQPYTSAQFYNASIYLFDTPQDANDFHAENSWSGGWNQEFRLKKGDTDKIEGLLSSS